MKLENVFCRYRMHRTSSRFKICGRSPHPLQGGKISAGSGKSSLLLMKKILKDIL
jgi:hypothetical protein